MTNNIKQILLCVAVLTIVALISAVNACKKNGYTGSHDYKDIKESGVLKVIVEDNKMSYYTIQCDSVVECDSLDGLQVKMIKSFAEKHGLDIEFKEERNLSKAIDKLLDNEVDILVWHIPVYNDMKSTIAYTIPVFTSRQKLIQRKKIKGKIDTTLFITNQLDLAEKHIYIVPGSIFKHRLEHLQKEIGDTIYLHEIPESNDNLLFRMVSDTVIDYSVCDEFVARVLQKDYPDVDMSTAVSFTQNYSWGVNPEAASLLDSLNNWLSVYLESKEYNKIYRKYTGVK